MHWRFVRTCRIQIRYGWPIPVTPIGCPCGAFIHRDYTKQSVRGLATRDCRGTNSKIRRFRWTTSHDARSILISTAAHRVRPALAVRRTPLACLRPTGCTRTRHRRSEGRQLRRLVRQTPVGSVSSVTSITGTRDSTRCESMYQAAFGSCSYRARAWAALQIPSEPAWAQRRQDRSVWFCCGSAPTDRFDRFQPG